MFSVQFSKKNLFFFFLISVIKESIHILTISPCGKYLVCAGLCNNISVWTFVISSTVIDSWKHFIKLPQYKVPPTSISIRPNSSTLAAVFPDRQLFEYDLEELRFTFLTIIRDDVGLEATHPINNITFDPRNENILLVHNDTNVCVLKKGEMKLGKRPNRKSKDKVQKLDVETEKGGLTSCCFVKVVQSYKVQLFYLIVFFFTRFLCFLFLTALGALKLDVNK